LPLVDDGTDVRAPIAGVVAGLRAAANDVCVFLPVDCPLILARSLRALAGAVPARAPTGPLPGAYDKSFLPRLERKLADGHYSLRDVPATVVELDDRELANVNSAADLAALIR
jgi:molybdopterin-guanine dinucleotide biosynthesis protein A